MLVEEYSQLPENIQWIIAESIGNISDDKVFTPPLDIKMFINGIEVNFNLVCEGLIRNFDISVENRAKELAQEIELDKYGIWDKLEEVIVFVKTAQNHLKLGY